MFGSNPGGAFAGGAITMGGPCGLAGGGGAPTMAAASGVSMTATTRATYTHTYYNWGAVDQHDRSATTLVAYYCTLPPWYEYYVWLFVLPKGKYLSHISGHSHDQLHGVLDQHTMLLWDTWLP